MRIGIGSSHSPNSTIPGSMFNSSTRQSISFCINIVWHSVWDFTFNWSCLLLVPHYDLLNYGKISDIPRDLRGVHHGRHRMERSYSSFKESLSAIIKDSRVRLPIFNLWWRVLVAKRREQDLITMTIYRLTQNSHGAWKILMLLWLPLMWLLWCVASSPLFSATPEYDQGLDEDACKERASRLAIRMPPQLRRKECACLYIHGFIHKISTTPNVSIIDLRGQLAIPP